MSRARDPSYIRLSRGNHTLGIVYVLDTDPPKATADTPAMHVENEDDWQDEPAHEDEFADWFGSFD